MTTHYCHQHPDLGWTDRPCDHEDHRHERFARFLRELVGLPSEPTKAAMIWPRPLPQRYMDGDVPAEDGPMAPYVAQEKGLCPTCLHPVWDGDRIYCELHRDFKDDPPEEP